ncbi:MAG: M23 family metallopeptidase [Marinicaulis sp.]|nr:M23 family metallopeptidase [Marinicaulis sp.]
MRSFRLPPWRLVIFAIGTAGLTACATAPSSTPPSRVFSATLHLCSGGHIDNAPAANKKKHILGFSSLTRVSGVTLARAPVQGACLSSGFGPRHNRPGTHAGVDYSTKRPRAVYAAGDGVIEEMRTVNGYGKMFLIRHNNRVQTRYGHLSSYTSKLHVGHKVRQGDIIGRTGKTGNATGVILHYEILVRGRARNPLTVGE